MARARWSRSGARSTPVRPPRRAVVISLATSATSLAFVSAEEAAQRSSIYFDDAHIWAMQAERHRHSLLGTDEKPSLDYSLCNLWCIPCDDEATGRRGCIHPRAPVPIANAKLWRSSVSACAAGWPSLLRVSARPVAAESIGFAPSMTLYAQVRHSWKLAPPSLTL